MRSAFLNRRLMAFAAAGWLAACGTPEDSDTDADAIDRADEELVEAVRAGEVRVTVDLVETEADLLRWPDPVARYRALKQHVRESMHRERFKVEFEYANLPVFAARLEGRGALVALATRPEVAWVHAERVVELSGAAASSFEFIRRDRTVSALGANFQGEGTYVAVLDTGLDYAGIGTTADATTAGLAAKRAEAFGTCTAGTADSDGGVPLTGTGCHVDYVRDFAPADGVHDDGGHGTNVAGVVAMVAPKARLLGLDVFTLTNGKSAGSSLDINNAINWVVGERAKYNTDPATGRNVVAINMSLGGGKYKAACGSSDPFYAPIVTARAAGILSVAASGNDGYRGYMGSPACIPSALSVGASLWTGATGARYPGAGNCTDGTNAADTPSCFSNTASFLTILAPGVVISAAGITMQGTSQATPHVAGAVAVLAGAIPESRGTTGWAAARVDDLQYRLTKGAPLVYDSRVKLSFPRLDLLSAAVGASTSGSIWTNQVNQSISVPVTLSAAGYTPQFKSYALTTSTGTSAFDLTTFTDLASMAANVTNLASSTFTVPKGTKSGTVYPVSGALRAEGGETIYANGALLRVDIAGPVKGKATAVGTGTTGGVTLSWSGFSDPLSGIVKYRVFATGSSKARTCADTPTAEVAADTASYTSTGLTTADGVKQNFAVCAVDGAGNMSGLAAASGFSIPEGDGPQGTVTIGGGNASLSTNPATLAIIAVDASPVTAYCVTLSDATDCKVWKTLSGGTSTPAGDATSYEFTVTAKFPEGAVAVWLMDKWGNVAKVQSMSPTNAVVDSQAPKGSVATLVRGSGTLTLTLGTIGKASTAWTDATTGIQSILLAYSTSASPPAKCTGTAVTAPMSPALKSIPAGSSITYQSSATGKVYYRVCAVDAYGNTSAGKTFTLQ